MPVDYSAFELEEIGFDRWNRSDMGREAEYENTVWTGLASWTEQAQSFLRSTSDSPEMVERRRTAKRVQAQISGVVAALLAGERWRAMDAIAILGLWVGDLQSDAPTQRVKLERMIAEREASAETRRRRASSGGDARKKLIVARDAELREHMAASRTDKPGLTDKRHTERALEAYNRKHAADADFKPLKLSVDRMLRIERKKPR